MNEERKGFFFFASLLDPHTKSLSFCDDKHFPTSWKREGHGFLTMEFKSFYSEIHATEVDLPHQDTSVHQPSSLSDLLGDSTSMDVDVDSVETDLNAYTRVQQVPLDTDPLWWKQSFPLTSTNNFVILTTPALASPVEPASPAAVGPSLPVVRTYTCNATAASGLKPVCETNFQDELSTT